MPDRKSDGRRNNGGRREGAGRPPGPGISRSSAPATQAMLLREGQFPDQYCPEGLPPPRIASSAGKQLEYMAGSDTKGHPAGTKTGDLLHVFSNISIDPAGNVWAADNWNDLHVATGLNHDPLKSTWGGGDGVTVLYGAAPPVKPPRMGPVRTY